MAKDLELFNIYPWFDEWQINPGDCMLSAKREIIWIDNFDYIVYAKYL
ncbi:hypothetical protein ACFLRG_03785 [Bacteroidota bacterium]